MIKTTLYQCETCGARYYTEEECTKCERRHVGAVEIQDMYFSPCESYPTAFSVKMGDGALKIYRAENVAER